MSLLLASPLAVARLSRMVWERPAVGRWVVLVLSVVTTLAADKNGVAPSAISVPKGPGSIEGLGESFQPTLNTGTATYGVDLKLVPGVAGHQPSLELRYDGGGGNGSLGYGWSMPLPYVQRRTDQGIPTYGEALGVVRPDVFMNELREELVPREDGFHFCKNEGSFLRYRQVGDHWEAHRPDGTRLEFGLSPSARIEDGARIFCWHLERETDTHGNVIEYSYRSFPGEENRARKYLVAIRYGAGAPPWKHFHFAGFEYEDRPDWFEDGRAGFLVRTGKRLKSVLVGTQGVALDGHLAGDFDGDGAGDYLNRRYDLEYVRYAGTHTHWSLLEKVRLVGADGIRALPPSTFHYAICNPPAEVSAMGRVLGAINEPSVVMDNEFVELLDVNADGLPDLLRTELAGAHSAYLNRGTIRLEGAEVVRWSGPVAIDPGAGGAWNFDLASPQTHLADMDGDGLADLVHKSVEGSVFYFANAGRLAWTERREMVAQDSSPPAPFGEPNIRTADFDFDKRLDIVQSLEVAGSTAYRIWFNLGDQRYSTATTIEPVFAFSFSLPGVQIADCNGDRVPDLARIQPHGVVALAGLGYGRFAAPMTMSLPDLTLDEAQIAKAKLTDLNGDGLADLVLERAAPGLCWYWLNLGNYTFSPRKAIVDLPATISENAAVRWADLNGSGTTDLVYADSQATPRLQAIDLGALLTDGLSPNTLIGIDNGIGKTTQIEYAPSTRFALEDAAAGRPWPDPLPFPVSVVASVKVLDSLGHEYVTRFRYHDGYYDSAEKQFRGFGHVEQIEAGEPAAPTLVSRSRFDTGRDFEVMKGKLLRHTAEQSDGKVFWDETRTWAVPPRILMVGTNGESVRFAHPTGTRRDVLELGEGQPRRLESETEFDQYGNQTRSAQYGIVEGGDRKAHHDERITTTEFAINTNAWILRLPRRQEVSNGDGIVVARTESFYDDETFSGTNFGLVSVGNLTLQRAWIAPSNSSAFVQAARTRYDAFGNAVAALDPLADPAREANGHVRHLTYDDQFHSYAVRESIHLGQGKTPLVYAAEYDQGQGTILAATDPNGNSTRFGYDALGRLIRVLRPGDPLAYPTAEYEYVVARRLPGKATGAAPIEGIVNYVETRQRDRLPNTVPNQRDHYLISRQYTDGLGRALMTRGEAEPASGQTAPRVVVNGTVQFNARQKPGRVLRPFFTTRQGPLEELLDFENIENDGWRGQFDENGRLVDLDLPSAPGSTTEFDATLRPVRMTNADGTATRTAYEPLLTRTFDENDLDPASPHFATPMVRVTDGLGRVVQVDEVVHLNDDGTRSPELKIWTTRYSYEADDTLTQIIDSQQNVKTLRYDGLKRKIWMNDPDAGISTQTYDDASNLIETVDAKGQRITCAYDGANRLLSEDYHDDGSPEFSYQRTPDVAYFYDEPAPGLDLGNNTRATAQNTRGALAYVRDVTGEEHTSFDARGRMIWTVKRIANPLSASKRQGAGGLASYQTAFEYDGLDRVIRLTYPDNDQVSYEYNARGLLQRVVGGPSGQVVRDINYLPSGQQSQIEYGNGVRTSYRHDRRHRLTSLATGQSAPGDLLQLRYEYDAASNLIAMEDQRELARIPAADPRRNSQNFTYDDLYRLTRVQYPAVALSRSTQGQISYRYDRIGNLVAQTSDLTDLERGLPLTDLGKLTYGGSAGTALREGRAAIDPPGPHALTGIEHDPGARRSFRYDASGNMTQLDGLRCTWDFKDRLVAVEDGTMRAEYRYDFMDRRITKRVMPLPQPGQRSSAASAVAAVSEMSSVIYVGKHFEVREHEEPTKYIFNGDTRLARVTGSLSSNTRIQRFPVQPGWNLLALAVTAPDALRQMTNAEFNASSAPGVFRWDTMSHDWLPVAWDETLTAGTVFWLCATTSAMLSVSGTYTESGDGAAAVGLPFIASPTFSALPMPREGERAQSGLAWSRFDAFQQRWQLQDPSIATFDRPLAGALPPGQAIFVRSGTGAVLELPDPALRLRYYHQDHLGSSSIMTDAQGALVEETAFYPFGVERHVHLLRGAEEPYKFTQKERDGESGLHYFEARHMAGSLARFLSIDPMYLHPDGLSPKDLSSFLSSPQSMNLYQYGSNNPLTFTDPSGLDKVSTVSTASDVVGIAAGATEEASLWGSLAGVSAPKALNTAAGVAGKVTAGVSVGIKTVEFISDPSSATGGQLANETAKTLTGIAIPPVGLIWSVLDLTGYGPSSILENTEKSIEANRKATAAYNQAAAAYRETARIVNEAAPRIEAQHRYAAQRLGVLERETAKLNQKTGQILKGDTRTLEEINADIARLEKLNRRGAGELKRIQAHVRKLQQD